MNRDSKSSDAYASDNEVAGWFQFKMPCMQVVLDVGCCLSYWKQYVWGYRPVSYWGAFFLVSSRWIPADVFYIAEVCIV